MSSENIIRFIDSDYTVLFYLPDGGNVGRGAEVLGLSRRPHLQLRCAGKARQACQGQRPQTQGGGEMMCALHRMNAAQFRRARKLVRRLCANYDGGNCLLLDDGDLCPCPQLITPTLICKYSRAAVLPADRELWAEIMDSTHSWKRCILCGSRFLPRSNRAVCCDRCARQEARRRTRDRVRRHKGRL